MLLTALYLFSPLVRKKYAPILASNWVARNTSLTNKETDQNCLFRRPNLECQRAFVPLRSRKQFIRLQRPVINFFYTTLRTTL